MNPMLDYVNSLSQDELKAFLASVRGDKPNETKRDIVGDELEKTMTMLRLLKPVSTSNNQHSITDVYRVGNIEYRVTYFGRSDVDLQEVTKNV